MEKIKSKYVLDTIFTFIKDSKLKYKLVVYSKLLQKKLCLKLFDYQKKYIDKFSISFNKYFSHMLNNNEYSKEFDKYILFKLLEEDLIYYKIDINLIKLFLIDYLEKYINEFEKEEYDKNYIQLDIFSPFFDFISNLKYFEDIFNIIISIDEIEKYNLKKDYISCFNKLKKLNYKYSSITIFYNNNENLKNLEEFPIKFNYIKDIKIIEGDYKLNNYDYFFKFLLGNENIQNNLLYLNINLSTIKTIEINLIENLNNFKSLTKLELSNFDFKTIFTLKLFNLQKLSLNQCKNLAFEENCFLNLKDLFLSNCTIFKPKSLLEMPELEICQLDLEIEANNIFNFTSLKNLKKLTCKNSEFLQLNHSLLEYIDLNENNKPIKIEIERETIIKLCTIKTLKEINLNLKIINNEEISKIEGENKSVEKLYINWNNKNDECILFGLQKKFPNLSNLRINDNYSINSSSTLEIEEDINSKVNILDIMIFGGNNIKLYCQPYEKLIKISLYVFSDDFNLKDSLFFFSDKVQIIFNSLTHFEFGNMEFKLDLKLVKNLYNNLDKMPNLKKFFFDVIMENIDEVFYLKFIRKILSIKFVSIDIYVKNNFNEKKELYSAHELKELFPDFVDSNSRMIRISKLK